MDQNDANVLEDRLVDFAGRIIKMVTKTANWRKSYPPPSEPSGAALRKNNN